MFKVTGKNGFLPPKGLSASLLRKDVCSQVENVTFRNSQRFQDGRERVAPPWGATH